MCNDTLKSILRGIAKILGFVIMAPLFIPLVILFIPLAILLVLQYLLCCVLCLQ